MKLKILTVLTHHNGYSKLLESHLINNKIEYKFLGFGEKWKGWTWRMDLLKNELNNIDETKYVVAIIDSFDVIMLDDEKTLLDKYKKINKDIIISVNTIIKDSNQIVYFLTSKLLNRLYNGGIYIGNPKKIVELYDKVRNRYNFNNKYKKIDKDVKFDDEIELNNFVKDKENEEYIKNTIYFDYNNDLVFTDNPGGYMFYNKKYYGIENKKIISYVYNPSFIHTIGHFNKEIIENFNLPNDHRFNINIKTMVESTQYLNIVLLIFVILIILVIE